MGSPGRRVVRKNIVLVEASLEIRDQREATSNAGTVVYSSEARCEVTM